MMRALNGWIRGFIALHRTRVWITRQQLRLAECAVDLPYDAEASRKIDRILARAERLKAAS
jgi:hypothetical protein